MDEISQPHLQLALRIAQLLQLNPVVEAVGLGGSLAHTRPDSSSDVDVYVFTTGDFPVGHRQKLVEQLGGSTIANMGLDYWGAGDEWVDAQTGIEVDLVIFDAHWMEQQLIRVVDHCLPSLGYSTCFWFTCQKLRPLFDRRGWLAGIQTRAAIPYPEQLRKNIVHHNHPVLRKIIPSYYNQIAKAVSRGDAVSVNHRTTAFLASYFDILFALNRVLHPGEKRMLDFAVKTCTCLPVDFEADIVRVLNKSGCASPGILDALTCLCDHLDETLLRDGMIVV